MFSFNLALTAIIINNNYPSLFAPYLALLHLQILNQVGSIVDKVLFIPMRRLLRMQQHLIEPDRVVLERDARVSERLERFDRATQRNMLKRVPINLEYLVAFPDAQLARFRLLLDSGYKHTVAFIPASLYAKHQLLISLRPRQSERSLFRFGGQSYGQNSELLVHFFFTQDLLKPLDEIVQLFVRLEVIEMIRYPLEHNAVHLFLQISRSQRAQDQTIARLLEPLAQLIRNERWRVDKHAIGEQKVLDKSRID